MNILLKSMAVVSSLMAGLYAMEDDQNLLNSDHADEVKLLVIQPAAIANCLETGHTTNLELVCKDWKRLINDNQVQGRIKVIKALSFRIPDTILNIKWQDDKRLPFLETCRTMFIEQSQNENMRDMLSAEGGIDLVKFILSRDTILEVKKRFELLLHDYTGMITSMDDKFDLHLMSELSDENKIFLKDTIYLEKAGDQLKYKVLNPAKKIVEDTLDIHIDEELTSEILVSLKPEILEQAFRRGHVYNYYVANIYLVREILLSHLDNYLDSTEEGSVNKALLEILKMDMLEYKNLTDNEHPQWNDFFPGQ